MDGWVGGRKEGKAGLRIAYSNKKNGPYLSCDLHKLGVNFYCKLPVAPFSYKKVWHWKEGWMDGWMNGKAVLRIAYSNQKSLSKIDTWSSRLEDFLIPIP